MLLKSIHKKEHASFDKLREIAPGFVFEADLWLTQGDTMQSKGPSEYSTALKCFEMALDCMDRQGLVPHRQVFLNMGVLHHAMGNLKAAKKFICHSLSAVTRSSDDCTEEINPIFRRPENDIFYWWSEPLCSIEVCDADALQEEGLPYGQCYMRLTVGNSDELSLAALFQVDDDLLVGDFVLRVLAVGKASLKCAGMINVPFGCSWQVQKKNPGNNFNKDTITNCFNLARVQEDSGNLQAAREIYIELLKRHPSYVECTTCNSMHWILVIHHFPGYLRLSLMARDIGRSEEATHWVSQALIIDPSNADAIVVNGTDSSHHI